MDGWVIQSTGDGSRLGGGGMEWISLIDWNAIFLYFYVYPSLRPR